MKTALHHGVPSVARRGVGSHARVSFGLEATGEWDGHYEFSSHGMTAQDIVDKVNALRTYHGKKSTRLNGWRTLLTQPVVIGGNAWMLDVTVHERGDNVELFVGAVRVDGTDQTEIRSVYATIDDVPTDGQIVQMVKQKVAAAAAVVAQHASMVSAVAGMLP